MEVNIDQKELRRIILNAAAVADRAAFGAESHLLLIATDSMLVVKACNGGVFISSSAPCAVETQGRVLVPHIITNIIASLPSEIVTLRTMGRDNEWVEISTRNTRFVIHAMVTDTGVHERENMLSDPLFSLEADDVNKMAKFVSGNAMKNYMLSDPLSYTGIGIWVNGSISAMETNGHALFIGTVSSSDNAEKAPPPFNAVVPTTFLKTFSVFDNKSPVSVTVDTEELDNNVTRVIRIGLSQENLLLVARAQNLSFPNLTGIADTEREHRIFLDSTEMAKAIKQAKILSSGSSIASVNLRFEDQLITIQSNTTSLGDAKASVEYCGSAPVTRISLDPDVLLKALANMSGDVHISFSDDVQVAIELRNASEKNIGKTLYIMQQVL